ncbi:AAA family ATPase [uncultured Clostridium sp.]|uniref:AAA family ATPase n=1 Tax=uncultured Clostridium sp. TaxID=59620 RepID=UPI003216CC73
MKLDKHVHLVDFETISTSFKNVDIGLEHISSKNLTEVYNIIFKKIKLNRKLVQDGIIECFKILDEFDIEFNVNSKEDIRNTSPDFKSIRRLSLGQKVAALLTFVFKFGIINNDNTTLIIDQPEDNLDNTYIYKTLVESLKSVKDSRQVIIVTHSSTIVTNANAEQVIVMKADGKNGWKEKVGYPTEPVIIKHIINYLEGGEDSFKHKVDMYKSVINFNIS